MASDNRPGRACLYLGLQLGGDENRAGFLRAVCLRRHARADRQRRAVSGGRLCRPGAFARIPIRGSAFGAFADHGVFRVLYLGAGQRWALVSGGAGKTAVLVYTMPFWLIVLAWPLLGERMRCGQWLAAGLAFAGLICLFHPWQTHPHLASTVLACLAGFSWALAGVWNKYFRSRVQVDLIALNAWQLMIGAVPLFLIAVFVESRPIAWTPYFMAAVAYNAVLATAVAWTLWFFALQKMPAGMAGLGTLATPVLGVLAAWLQLGEVPLFWEAVGMVMIFFGLAILSGIGVLAARKA